MQFDIGKIYQKVWGYEPPEPQVFKIPAAPERKLTSNLGGSPFFDTDLNGMEHNIPVRIDGYLLPFAIITMNWKKTIIETAMPERGGSVNELISLDDYEFNIKGLFVNDDGSFPEQGIIDIRDIWLKNSSIEMRSVVSDIVLNGAYHQKVIIKDITWPATPGVEHVKAFEINVKSDMIFDLELV
jgi:hypothetical protein